MLRKLLSEFVGTMLLVVFGCGTAVAVNTYVSRFYNISLPFTMILIALTFGLILMALVFSIGKVSGCHINPAVTIGCLINGRISVLDAIEYIVVQVLGGIVGAEIIGIIFGGYNSLGANGYGALSALPDITTIGVAIAIEAILTFVFVLTVLSVTAKKNDNAALGIGLSLTLVHLMGLPFTGTSVNPARSIGPALLTGGEALNQLWVFILAPIIGAVLAGLFYRYIIEFKEQPKIEVIPELEKELIIEDDVKKTEPKKKDLKTITKKTPTKKTTKK